MPSYRRKTGWRRVMSKLGSWKVLAALFIILTVPAGIWLSSRSTDPRSQASHSQRRIDPAIGVSFVGANPDYIPSLSQLNPGLDEVEKYGFLTYEIYIGREVCAKRQGKMQGMYNQLDFCPEVTGKGTLKEMAQSPTYTQVFERDYHTLFITSDSVSFDSATAFRIAATQQPFTQSQLDSLYREFYDFTYYLLSEYGQRGGKTIIIQTPNELDWHLVADKTDIPLTQRKELAPEKFAVDNAIKYLNTISDAINQAKADYRTTNNQWTPLRIFHACEVNTIEKTILHQRSSAVEDVVPYTNCDLYGYSSYETGLEQENPELFLEALRYLEKKAKPSPEFGEQNVYISEFGIPDGDAKYTDTAAYQRLLSQRINEALSFGSPYFLFWTFVDQQDCNKTCPGYRVVLQKSPSDDLTTSRAWEVLKKYTIQLYNGRYERHFTTPETVKAGQPFTLTVNYTNTGSTPWSRSALIRLGAKDKQTEDIIGRLVMDPGVVMHSQQIGAFRGQGTAPTQPGRYTLKFQPLKEWYQWFDEPIEIQLEVK